ncbi:MAG: hypothetical protein JSS75_00220 [Bacteroidetes bacterium]|nr:hypothetical protein [Bacteroidota bacterium]
MKKITVIALLAAMIGFVGCGKKEGGPGNQYNLSTKNNVVWWQLSDVTNLIPYVSHDASAPYVFQMIWEPLNSSNPKTQELIPWIASLPEVSPDHKVYTYTIRKDVTFSDGQPLTGEDVIYSFKTAMNPNILDATSLGNYLNSVDSVALVGGDKYKVAFYLSEPYYLMDRVLGGGYVLILPKHIFDPNNMTDKIAWPNLKHGPVPSGPGKDYADKFDEISKDRSGKYYIGSGPYLFKSWRTNDNVTISLNKKYWAKDIPWGEAYVDEIIYKTITDPNAAVTALKGKDVDFMDNVTPPALWVDIKQPYIKRDTYYFNVEAYLAWNSERPLFKDKKVRWALSHLVDRDQIINTVMKGLCQKVDGPIIFTQPNYCPEPPVSYNVDSAKALLAEAGWTDSDGDGVLDKVIDGKKIPFKFTFQTNAGNEARKQILLIVAEQLRKVGIQAEVQAVEWSVFLQNLRQHNFDACFSAITGNAGEDDPFQLWHSSQAKNRGSNIYSFINPEADKLLEQNRMEFDPVKRKALMQRFSDIVHEEQPVTFLWAQPELMARIDRFDNVEFNRQRPCVAIPVWVVRGSGVTPKPGAPSTVKETSK